MGAFTTSNLFESELRKILAEEIADLTANLAGGTSAKSYDEYQHEVGRIRGLKTALEACDEAATIVSQKG